MNKIKNFNPDDWNECWANGTFYMHKTSGENISCDDYRHNCDIYNARPENHVFEATITKTGQKAWQYFYTDENDNNQHSGYFNTKEEAIEAYRKNHPRMVQVPETMIEEMLQWANARCDDQPHITPPEWFFELNKKLNQLNQ